MRVVLDTNVLVSGLLSPFGPCADILRLLATGDVVPCVDARILVEYDEVLHRPFFQFEPDDVDILIDHIAACGEHHTGKPLHSELPDPDDHLFLEVALAANADCLVTGNLKHFPPARRQGVRVVSAKKFLDLRREG